MILSCLYYDIPNYKLILIALQLKYTLMIIIMDISNDISTKQSHCFYYQLF